MSKQGPRPFRPKLHFTAPKMWLNDPNGLVYEGGRYHLYYQHYPEEPVWGPMHWGHASSADLIHWEHHPIALYPDALGYIFSGSAVLDEADTSGFGALGKAPIVAMYTSHGESEQQSIAYSLDGGLSFQKYPANPVIPNPGIENFRDPKVFRNPVTGSWSMVLSAHDRVHFYASDNLRGWRKTGEFGQTENRLPGSIFECPDLFPLTVGGKRKWVLLASMILTLEEGGHRTQYFIGDFDGERFICDTPFDTAEFIDCAYDNYAGCTYWGAPARTFIGWGCDPRYAPETPTGEYCGQMTLAREVSLRETPLGGARLAFKPLGLGPLLGAGQPVGSDTALPGEVFGLQVRGGTGFSVTLGNEAGEELRFGLDDGNRLFVDRSRASCKFSENFDLPVFQAASAPRFYAGECVLDAVFDVSSLEVYADHGTRCFSQVVYPTVPYTRIRVEGARAELFPIRA